MSVSLLIALVAVGGLGMWLANYTGTQVRKCSLVAVEVTPSIAAWLSGGARRAAELWWVQLTERSLLVPAADCKTYDAVANATLAELDIWAQKAFAQTGRSLSSGALLQAWARPLAQLGEHLAHAGWIHHPAARQSREQAVFVFFLVGGVGSMVGGFFGGWGIWSVLVLAEVIGFSLHAHGQIPPRLTAHGAQVLDGLRQEHYHATLAPQKGDIGMAVAVGGAAVLVGTPFEAYASPAARKQEASSSGCGSGGCAAVVTSWGGDSSGGDGASGCGGGGGGCGGCGS